MRQHFLSLTQGLTFIQIEYCNKNFVGAFLYSQFGV